MRRIGLGDALGIVGSLVALAWLPGAAGKKVIALPAKKVPASAGSITLKSFPSGSLEGVAAWKLNVVCTLKGKSTTTVRNLKTFEVVPNAKA